MKIKSLFAVLAVLVTLGGLPVAVAPAFADPPAGGKQMKGWPLRWKATSPAIHEGDRYDLSITNTGEEAQEVRVRAFIMDHANHTNTDVVDEQVELAPGEEREFSAVNDYGDANHFNTILGSASEDLALAVSVADAEGTETARFNDKAFLVQEGKARGAAKGAEAHAHGHDEGFLAAIRDAARLSPLWLGAFAVAGFGLHAVRRRSGRADGLLRPVVPSRSWRAVAVGGLSLSAALHVGLAPAHLGEAAIQGVFFYVAGVAAAVLAAAVLVSPSRPAYLAGAGLSLALILLWAVFRVVPPPGAEAAEAVDLVGVLTKTTELIAAAACAALWLQDRRGSTNRALEGDQR